MKKFFLLSFILLGCGSSESVFGPSDGGSSFSSNPSTSVGTGGSGGTTSSGGMSGSGGAIEPVPCDGECTLDNAFSTCLNNECVIEGCVQGFTDCNGQPGDGCETQTSNDLMSCGGCGVQCEVPNATPVCQAGQCSCQLNSQNKCECSAQRADCDTSRENGCEADLASKETCGSCGVTCSGQVSFCNGVSCQCPAWPGYPNGVSYCRGCLETNCCDELDSCLSNSGCTAAYNTWASCKGGPNPEQCCFGCSVNNPQWLALRQCQQSNSCSCGG